MSKEIEWDAVVMFEHTHWLRQCMTEYEAIAGVTSMLPEEMKTMLSFDAFQKRVQLLLDKYYQAVDADIASVEEVVNEMIACDQSIRNQIMDLSKQMQIEEIFSD